MPDPAHPPTPSTPRVRVSGSRLATTAGAALVLGAAWLLLAAESLSRPFSHDESWFLAVAAMIRDGLLPYRDMPCIHPPNFFFAASPFAVPGSFLMLLGRLGTVTAAVAVAALVGWRVRASLGPRHTSARVLGLAATAVVAFNPLLAATAGWATNYVYPSVAVLVALRWPRPGSDGNARLVGLALVGFWLSVAVGFRLSYVGAAAAVFLLLALAPRGDSRQRAADLAGLTVGGIVGGLPSLALLALAPGGFLFGTVRYHTLQPAFHRTYGLDRAMDAAGKLRYLAVDVIAREPALLLLVAGLFAAAVAAWRLGAWHGSRGPATGAAAAAISAGLLATALLPTPTWIQYLFAPVPFAVLAMHVALGRALAGSRSSARAATAVAAVVAAGTLALASPRIANLPRIFEPESWAPVLVHQLGEWTADHAGPGPVVTLAPIVPLEGGAAIDPAFATGPFAWRVAHRVEPGLRRRLGLVSRDDLDRHFAERPPGSLLLGFEGALEDPLREWAQRNGYLEVAGPARFRLWLAPGRPADPADGEGAATGSP